jgi:hemerythrin superfamily protein
MHLGSRTYHMKSPKKSTEQNPSKASKAAANGNQENSNGDADAAATSMDAVTLIKNDHRKVEALFEQFESASSEDKKAEIAKQVCTELIIHATIEEELFYPACREAEVEDDMLDEAQVEHDGVKVLIREIMAESPNEEFYDAKVKVLSEYVKHHVAEEEEPNNGILAKAQAADVDMDALGQKLQARKAELMRKAESRGLGMPVPKTLHNQPPQKRGNQQEDSRMNRNTYAERDERGRFVSDDDDDRRRYSRSERDDDDRRSGRSRDERGRFESDDERRSSSRRRDDDDYDDRRSSGGGRGWYGDSEGHSQAARSRRRDDDDYDDRRRSSSRDDDYGGSRGGGRGWSGDPEGHAEAARRGWEERGYSRSRSRSDDDDRRGSRSRDDEGHGGWFGDSRGHPEAARRGWDERSSGSRRRSDDDDRRRSRSRDDDEGQGGWFGDSRGHAEAARRGWQNR